MMSKNKIIILCSYLIFGVLLNSCNEKKETEVVFKIEVPAKEDDTKIWLRKSENYQNNKNYFPVFYNYYNNKITQQNYIDAAKILDVVSTKLVFFYDFNKKFSTTIKNFDSKYRNKLPALKTIRIWMVFLFL